MLGGIVVEREGCRGGIVEEALRTAGHVMGNLKIKAAQLMAERGPQVGGKMLVWARQ